MILLSLSSCAPSFAAEENSQPFCQLALTARSGAYITGLSLAEALGLESYNVGS